MKKLIGILSALLMIIPSFIYGQDVPLTEKKVTTESMEKADLKSLAKKRILAEEKVQKETLTWAINKEGFLIIDEFKSEEQQINFDALWQLDGEVLQAYDRETREKESLTLSRI